MLRAIDESKNEYLTWEENLNIDRNKKYFCPNCKSQAIFVDATKRIKHFRHFNSKSCGSEPESEEHLMMKKYLINILKYDKNKKNTTSEKKIGDQIADVYTEHKNTQIVFECQCSPISEDEYIQRTERWLNKEVHIIWIFGKNFYYENVRYQLPKKIFRNFYPIYFYTIKDWILYSGKFEYYYKKQRIINFKKILNPIFLPTTLNLFKSFDYENSFPYHYSNYNTIKIYDNQKYYMLK